jgi:hypothetical protein
MTSDTIHLTSIWTSGDSIGPSSLGAGVGVIQKANGTAVAIAHGDGKVTWSELMTSKKRCPTRVGRKDATGMHFGRCCYVTAGC